MSEQPAFFWDIPTTLPTLSAEAIHVWCAPLNQSPQRIASFAETLAPDEAARAQRFVFDHDREHFIVARGTLRQILGHYLHRTPAQINFKYADKGKPALDMPLANGLQFNLSHSGAVVLYAMTYRREIGIDVEAIRPLNDLHQIAQRFFSAPEYATLSALPTAQQPQGFFNCWSRKEAYIKAIGDGLTHPLDTFQVSLIPGEEACLLHVDNDPQATERWTLINLTPAPAYPAALIVEDYAGQLLCQQWPR